ncbi:MAG: MerR family transcriptional regulator [Rhodospirillaceae bacterium]
MEKKAAIVAESFSVSQAAKLSGVKKSMIDYLCRTEILVPTYPTKGQRSRGRPRLYSFGDVVMLRVLRGLLESGISVARLKKSLQSLRKYHKEITPKSLPKKFLVSDGQNVYLKQKSKALETLDNQGQFAFAFVIPIESVKNEILNLARKAS